MFDFKELIFQMRRRIISSRPSMNAPTTVPINWEVVKYCIHDIYLNKITKYDNLTEIVYENEENQSVNQSNFSLDITDYLINLKRKIDIASEKTLKMNIVKKDSNKKFGVSLIFKHEASSEILDTKIVFTCEMEGTQVEEFEIDIGYFDITAYNAQKNIFVGEQTFYYRTGEHSAPAPKPAAPVQQVRTGGNKNLRRKK